MRGFTALVLVFMMTMPALATTAVPRAPGTSMRSLLNRAVTLAEHSRGGTDATRTYSSRLLHTGGLTNEYWVLKDEAGVFYVFASLRPQPVLGVIELHNVAGIPKGHADTWTLASTTPGAPVVSSTTQVPVNAGQGKTFMTTNAAGSPVCDVVATVVFGLITAAVCPETGPGLIACLAAAGLAGHEVCATGKGGPNGGAAHWYPSGADPGNASGLSKVTECCNSPLVGVADYYMDSRGCLPTDYSTGGVGSCHSIDLITGQKSLHTVNWAVTIWWPDGNKTFPGPYSCTCTQFAPNIVMHSSNVPPGANYGMAIGMEEQNIYGLPGAGFVPTGHLDRIYTFNSN